MRIPLALFWGFTAYAFVVRTALQKLRTRDGGVRGISRDRGPLAFAAGILLVPAWLVVGIAPILSPATTWTPGIAVIFVGIALAIASQTAMGRAWRIGVAPDERTALVTHGPFRWVRNPFFTGMSLTAAGTTLSVPSLAGAVATVVLFATLIVQVREVEEPHLVRTFGEDFLTYARRTGRFLPGLGRLP